MHIITGDVHAVQHRTWIYTTRHDVGGMCVAVPTLSVDQRDAEHEKREKHQDVSQRAHRLTGTRTNVCTHVRAQATEALVGCLQVGDPLPSSD
jgi:hypothetical protein